MEAADENPGVDSEEERLDLDDETEQSEGVEGEQVLLREDGAGVEVSEGQREERGPGEGGVTGEWGGLDVEGGGRGIRGKSFSEPPEGEPLRLSKDGGVGGGGALSLSSDCVSGWSREVCPVSRSRESSCTTTSSTSVFLISSEARGASSPTEL